MGGKEEEKIMKKYLFEGKTKDEVYTKAHEELAKEDIIEISYVDKSSLLKKNVALEVTTMNDIVSYIKETLSEILKLMQIESKFEIRVREKTISVKLFSDNNAILIGKNGRTIGENICRIFERNQTNPTMDRIETKSGHFCCQVHFFG